MVHVVRVPSHCGCCVLFSACLVLSASADSCSPCSFPFSFLYRITRHDERPQWPATARASSRRCPSFNCCDRAAPRSQAQPSPLPPRCPAVAEPTTARAWSTARAPALDRVSKAALTSCRAAPPPVRRVCSAAPHVPRAPRALPCHSVSAATSSFLRLPRARVRGLGTVGHRWPCRRCLRTRPGPPLPRGRFSAVAVQPRPGLTAGRCSLCSVRSLLGKKQGEDGIYPSKRIIRGPFC